MADKFLRTFAMIACFIALSGSRNAPVNSWPVHDNPLRISEFSTDLDSYLRSFLDVNLPLQKYTSSVRWDAWERDCIRFPSGEPDPRGEKLFANVHLWNDPECLDIFFIGNNHIPLFHKALTQKRFKPYIISWHLQEDMDDWAPYFILRHLRRDPIAPPDKGKPCIIIGDCHGKNYRIAFPDPEALAKRNITKVHFHIELLEPGLAFEKQLEKLKNAAFNKTVFWGQRKIYKYIQELEKHNLAVSVEGIEPVKHR